MFYFIHVIVLLLISSCFSLPKDMKIYKPRLHKIIYQYQTKYFQALVDNFSYRNDSATYAMKYLISTEHWQKGNPILFYCGNEGSIELFANNSGFIWELGEELSAMVVFAEHRYYGSSLPFGNFSFNNSQYFGYLNSEQALADYANLLIYLKANIVGADKSAVIGFGGSYGGMLAAWFRQKYPNIVAGSLAASAPVLMVDRIENCNNAFRVLTQAYRTKGSDRCVENVRNTWKVIQSMDNPNGLGNLTKIFRTCKQIKQANDLISFITDGLFSMGMANYPYPNEFLAPMPAWPVTVFCNALSAPISDPIKLLNAFYSGLQVYYNYTGQNKCLPLGDNVNPGLDANGWNVQTCTELPMPMCTDGVTDMFYMNNFSKSDNDKQCRSSYGVSPRWGWGKTLFWGDRLKAASNIIFSNGNLDPWSAGGVMSSPNPSIKIITIPNGAHHVDLRSSNALDTSDIRLARKLEKLTIQDWINQWNSGL